MIEPPEKETPRPAGVLERLAALGHPVPPMRPTPPDQPQDTPGAASDAAPDQAGGGEIAETSTTAPRVGDHFGGFLSTLAADNDWRLPGVRADAGVVGTFWIAAASIGGLGHLQKGTTAQDTYQIALADDAVIAAVGDGLGSHPLTGQIGAEIATRSICAALRSIDPGGVRSSVREQFTKAVTATNAEMIRIRELAFLDLSERDLETTLAFCWIPRADANWLAVGRIGDCEIFLLRRGSLEPVFERGDGALNQVQGVLPAQDPAHHLEVRTLELEGVAAVVLTTDGLAGDVAGSPTVTDWLAQRWERPCGVHWMTDSLRYRRQGSHDDRTALVIWPRTSALARSTR